MDKRKLRLILLMVVGVIILVIGIGAATIYTQTVSKQVRDEVSQYFYGRDYDSLSDEQRTRIDILTPPQSVHEKNAQFRQWLVKWVAIPFCAFLILTGAIVASRVILDRTRPSSGSS
jgi:Trk-type K+ transport system membrane component